jgi:hypothetical protein
LQEEMGVQVDQLKGSWEEERRELVVQNQLLEEELADVKGMLVQERQRSAETYALKETIRRLRFENKEVIGGDRCREVVVLPSAKGEKKHFRVKRGKCCESVFRIASGGRIPITVHTAYKKLEGTLDFSFLICKFSYIRVY